MVVLHEHVPSRKEYGQRGELRAVQLTWKMRKLGTAWQRHGILLHVYNKDDRGVLNGKGTTY